MNAIAQHAPEPPKLPSLPILSPALARCLLLSAETRFSTNDPHDPGAVMVCASTPIAATGAEVDEARRALAKFDHEAPPRPEAFREWMLALNIGVQNTQAEKVFELRIAAYAPLASRYPATVFDQQSLVLAQSTFEFFPGTKRLADFLDARRLEIRNAAAALRRVANWQPAAAEQEWQQPSDAEKAQVADKLRAHRAWLEERRLADGDAERPRTRTQPRIEPEPDVPSAWQNTVSAVVRQAAAAREQVAA